MTLLFTVCHTKQVQCLRGEFILVSTITIKYIPLLIDDILTSYQEHKKPTSRKIKLCLYINTI